MKKIYIAYDNNNYPSSIILADNVREARIYWQGAGITAYSEEEIDPANIPEGCDIKPILKTEPKSGTMVRAVSK